MAIHEIVHDAYAVAKDASIDNINVTLDTSKWSKRKQNLIVRAITTGIADCGWDTGHFVKALAESYGLGMHRISSWSTLLSMDLVKPDKVVEVCAYISALIKMKGNIENRTYSERSFVALLETGDVPDVVPIPSSFSPSDRRVFVDSYLKDQDEAEKVIREKLINEIKSGHKLTISFTI